MKTRNTHSVGYPKQIWPVGGDKVQIIFFPTLITGNICACRRIYDVIQTSFSGPTLCFFEDKWLKGVEKASDYVKRSHILELSCSLFSCSKKTRVSVVGWKRQHFSLFNIFSYEADGGMCTHSNLATKISYMLIMQDRIWYSVFLHSESCAILPFSFSHSFCLRLLLVKQRWCGSCRLRSEWSSSPTSFLHTLLYPPMAVVLQ